MVRAVSSARASQLTEKNSTMNIFLFTQTSLGLGSRDYYVESTPEVKQILAATKPTSSASSSSRATLTPKPAASPKATHSYRDGAGSVLLLQHGAA